MPRSSAPRHVPCFSPALTSPPCTRPPSAAPLPRASHQRFFKLMLMASKVPTCAQLAVEAVRDGMCVVIGLQSTGEANTAAVSPRFGRLGGPGALLGAAALQ